MGRFGSLELVNFMYFLYFEFLSLYLDMFDQNWSFLRKKWRFWLNISKYRLKNSKCEKVKPRSDILQRVPALRAFWDLEKTVLHEIRVSGTVFYVYAGMYLDFLYSSIFSYHPYHRLNMWKIFRFLFRQENNIHIIQNDTAVIK